MDLSVVIAAKDAEATLGQQLDALLAQPHPERWEVIVVDNGSSDGTASLVRERAVSEPSLRLVDAAGRRGAAHARNIGAEHASSDLLAFCDSDDVVGPTWVMSMFEGLRRHAFVMGPLDVDTLNERWVTDARGRWLARDEVTTFDGIFPFASSCNMGVRRTAFLEVGGFDERFTQGQDVELSLRLWLAGVELAFVPEAVVAYRYRGDLRHLWQQARRYGSVHPLIYRRMQELGVPCPPRRISWRTWAWLIRRSPSLFSPQVRGRWLWVAGTKLGQLESSIRQRALYV